MLPIDLLLVLKSCDLLVVLKSTDSKYCIDDKIILQDRNDLGYSLFQNFHLNAIESFLTIHNLL